MDKLQKYKKLKSGTDIRGAAVETEGSPVELTDEAVYDLAAGFCRYLTLSGRAGSVAVGHDCRISSERIKSAVVRAVTDCGFDALDCSLSSTPAMFMTTVDLGCAGAVQITASHHPYDKNGLKFFTRSGSVDSRALDKIIELASDGEPLTEKKGKTVSTDFMSVYAGRLRDVICGGLGAKEQDKPLSGLKIAVDAGNGVGGFYARQVLGALGADVGASRFLEPDGTFPNHAPNPEDKTAMGFISAAVTENGCDMGVIFDTDVDRAAFVDESGTEINRNRLVALASALALEGRGRGAVIVTDSVTSTGLTEFIEGLGAVHYRYKRGYRNVIDKQLELISQGYDCPLAIETSGHASFSENYFLDDGAYLAAKIIVKAVLLKREGKSINDLIGSLRQPKQQAQFRLKIGDEDFKSYGDEVIFRLEDFCKGKSGWKIADDNREGLRVFLTDESANGWFLLRLSVHDPIMPLNIESDSDGGAYEIARRLLEFLELCDGLDISSVKAYLNSEGK